MVNGSVSIHLIGQGRGASDLQNLIICKVEMKVAGSMGNGCQKRVECQEEAGCQKSVECQEEAG